MYISHRVGRRGYMTKISREFHLRAQPPSTPLSPPEGWKYQEMRLLLPFGHFARASERGPRASRGVT